MKDKMYNYFIKVCKETAKLSTCQVKKVGAVLVKNDRILAISYNGSPSKIPHCCDKVFKTREEHSKWSEEHEIHAEANLVAYCAKNNISTDGATMFVSLSPCINCAKLIIQTGIKEVIYLEEYDRDERGIQFLFNTGISCEEAHNA